MGHAAVRKGRHAQATPDAHHTCGDTRAGLRGAGWVGERCSDAAGSCASVGEQARWPEGGPCLQQRSDTSSAAASVVAAAARRVSMKRSGAAGQPYNRLAAGQYTVRVELDECGACTRPARPAARPPTTNPCSTVLPRGAQGARDRRRARAPSPLRRRWQPRPPPQPTAPAGSAAPGLRGVPASSRDRASEMRDNLGSGASRVGLSRI